MAASTIFKENGSPRVGQVTVSYNICNGQHRPHQKPGLKADARKVLGLQNMSRKYGLAWIVGQLALSSRPDKHSREAGPSFHFSFCGEVCGGLEPSVHKRAGRELVWLELWRWGHRISLSSQLTRLIFHRNHIDGVFGA